MFANRSERESEGIEMNSLLELTMPPPEECVYTTCYCEENVWKLCEYVKKNQSQQLHECFVVFISNPSKLVPLWCQKAGNLDTMCIWDYHVIFIYHSSDPSRTVVYDLDSTLPFPVHIQTYLEKAVRTETVLQSRYHRKFRVVPAAQFLETFASDRSNMKNRDGSWIKPPPPYPCIRTEESSNNLQKFIDIGEVNNFEIGEVLNLRQFTERFFDALYEM